LPFHFFEAATGTYPDGASLPGLPVVNNKQDEVDDKRASSNLKDDSVEDAKETSNGQKSSSSPLKAAEERRALLKEVKDHLELLKDLESVIPASELQKRKKELFLSLPPAPSKKFKGKKSNPVAKFSENADEEMVDVTEEEV